MHERELAGWLARLQPAEILFDRERIPPAAALVDASTVAWP
jgi:hypothetical protein